MTTLLAPTYSLRIGSQIWKEQLLRLELTLTAAPGIDILSAVLPALAPLDAAVDDDVELTLDSGEQGDKVFTGVVAVIRRSHAAIDVKAVNAGGVLCRYRPAATYENATAATVVRNLASDVGVSTGSLETGSELFLLRRRSLPHGLGSHPPGQQLVWRHGHGFGRERGGVEGRQRDSG